MSEILTNNKHYSNIADTIRQMKGVATTYKPREMAGALREMYSTEVEGVPPLAFPSNGNNLLNYRIDGANGGVGDRTKNLANDNDMLPGYWAYADGTYIITNTWICTPKIACKGNVDYTFQFANNSRWYGFVWYDENNNFISTNNQQNNLQTGFRSFTAKSPSNAGYLVINIAGYPGTNDTIRTDDLINFQLEEGSTPTNYEPYGYKIPVVCGGTTTNIYIDEPIREDESISMEEANVNIPTINGTNIISIDTTVQPSKVYVQAPRTNNLPIEVIEQATAEGESLNLTNTKAMPYSDYVVKGKSEQEGEPSPSNPSEIHSVADDVNLFDVNSIPDLYTNFTAEKNNNHLIITATGTGGAQYCTSYVKNVDNTKNYTLSFKAKKIVKGTNGGPNIRFLVYGSNDDSNYSLLYTLGQDNPVEGQEYSFNRTFTSYKYYRFYIYNNTSNPVTIGEQTDYYDIKFQEGFIATPYSPYNQGTVTIKQRGKNLFNYDYAKEYSNTMVSNYRFVKIADVEMNQNYAIGNLDTTDIENESGLTIFITNYPDYSSGITNGNNICSNSNKLSTSFKSINVPTLSNSLYIGIYPTTVNETQWGKILNKFKNAMLVKGSYTEQTIPSYEAYNFNQFTIQTEPLRSLPNVVKDTIEADGIHRRVGRVVLDGSNDENWALSGTNTTGYYRFSSAIINNIVEKPSSNSQVVDIISNNYMKKSADNTYSLQTGICIATNGAIIIYDDNLKQYTVENFKTWLSTHNVEVLYELANEVIEPLTQNQANTMLDIIKTGSYENTTNIYTDEDVKPTIGVGYYKKS